MQRLPPRERRRQADLSRDVGDATMNLDGMSLAVDAEDARFEWRERPAQPPGHSRYLTVITWYMPALKWPGRLHTKT